MLMGLSSGQILALHALALRQYPDSGSGVRGLTAGGAAENVGT